MFIIKNLLLASTRILEIIINLAIFTIILDVVFSWVNASRYKKFVNSIIIISDLIMSPLKKHFNLIVGTIDLAPIITLMIFYFTKIFVIQSLFDLAARL